MSPDQAAQFIKQRALQAGFSSCAIARIDAADDLAAPLARFIGANYHGSMDWLGRSRARRSHPARLWPDARSLIMVALNYGPDHDPLSDLQKRDRGVISVYARHRDYHDVIKGRLKQLAGQLAARAGGNVKVFVDTAPLMEKPAAALAGIGWQGKHTNLVSREFGSWLLLGCLMTTLELPADDSHGDNCGSCRACLDICPTGAFPAAHQLDARLCISYLTIEHKGPIDRHLRPLMGNRVYGCDDCLAVCPWNKFASAASEAKLIARDDLQAPDLARLSALDEAGFRALFSGSPVKRTGRDRFVRNVLIAIGNSGQGDLIGCARDRLRDHASVVRGAAVWAAHQLLSADAFEDLRRQHLPEEDDPQVAEEWRAAGG